MLQQVPYQILFLILCIGAGYYVNRRKFNGFVQYINGIPVPSYVIAAALSIFIGLILWGFLNFLLFKIRS